jgi:hypothetical protein
MATSPLHTPFVCSVDHLSTRAEPNKNGTISAQGIHANAETLSKKQGTASQPLNERIQTKVSL